jgi:hypothetical protein
MREVAALVCEERVVDTAVDNRRSRLEGPLRVCRLDLERAVDDERLGGCGRRAPGTRCDGDRRENCHGRKRGFGRPWGTETVHVRPSPE